jgi:superfamily I DNA/RNA helicase
MGLTPSQEAAVMYERDLIIFAGPGSGKTATSVRKGVRILSQPDSRLCMITFTTAGAGEMQERMAKEFEARNERLPTSRLTTGTFHALTLRHYNRHANSRRKLMSPAARGGLVRSMLSHLEPIDSAQYSLALEKYQGALHPERLEFPAGVSDFIAEYHQRLRAVNAIDLAGTMRECVLGMQQGHIPLFPLTHMIGDEMQDADEIQLELMLIHAKAGVITTLVGDDDQTIYEWRSALGYEGLMHFARETGAKTITLAENFRSHSEIVSHAQMLISHNNPSRVDKHPRAIRGPGGRIGVVSTSDTERECALIARAIYRHRTEGESVAILARSNIELMQMEQALSGHKTDDQQPASILYKRDGQSMWRTPEVSSLVCLLQALVKGQTSDLVAVLCLLKISRTTRARLEQALGPTCGGFLDGHMPLEINSTDTDELNEIKALTTVTKRCRQHIRKGEIPFAIDASGEKIRQLLKQQEKARPKQINALLSAAENVLGVLSGTLSTRLATISRMQEKEADPSAVRLITLHSSKGLEFDTVFLLNCSDPDDGSTLFSSHPERRLFYVGVTRAKNRLVVSYSGKPVRFIAEAGLPHHHSIEAILT